MPNQLWALSTREFVDMHDAHIAKTNEMMDIEMQRTAWFTAMLMNASGNIKKHIKPEDLYVSVNSAEKKNNPKEQKDYVNRQREELKEKFNI